MEVRRRQQEELERRQRQQQQQQAAASGAAAPKKQPAAAGAAAADAWAADMERIMAPSGGVAQARHAPLLLALLSGARTLAHRSAACVVLGRSSREVLREVVARRGLLTLQAWLADAAAGGRPKLAAKLLACLDRMPVTTAALTPPCELGKLVGRLRKDPGLGPEAQAAAKALVAKWTGIVEAEAEGRLLQGRGGAGGGYILAFLHSAASSAVVPLLLSSSGTLGARPVLLVLSVLIAARRAHRELCVFPGTG